MIKKACYWVLSFCVLPISAVLADQNFIPENIMILDGMFGHHVIIAEKSTHTLYLFGRKNNRPELVSSFPMATGKMAGNKVFQGDYRTPEGVYNFEEFLTHEQLIEKHGKEGEIYGVGAFVMNYPNPIDQREGKTGHGIWLHSTNDETRIEKGLDSRGCIVAHNRNLIEISKYIELNRTPLIVVQDLKYLTEERWTEKRDQLQAFVDSWLTAWREEDIDKYIEHYHPKEFHDDQRGNFKQFKDYKKAVFWGPGKPEIQASNLSILKGDDYAVVTFRQNYISSTVNDIGKKTLYLKKDEYYNWRIVSEQWTKKGVREEEETVAFQPSMRFFKSQNPSSILGDKLIVAPVKNN